MKILILAFAAMLVAGAARAQTYSYVVSQPFLTYQTGQCITGSAAASLIEEGYGNSLVRVSVCGGSTTPVTPPASSEIQIIAAVGTGQSDGSPIYAKRTIITGTVSAAAGTLQPGFNQNLEITNQSSINYPVYPPVGGTINGLAVNLPVAVPVGATASFASTDGVAWVAP